MQPVQLRPYARIGIMKAHNISSNYTIVEVVVRELVYQQDIFTAYDVTRLLRSMFSNRMLPHYDVQGCDGIQTLVHHFMENYVQVGDYVVRDAVRNNRACQEYAPNNVLGIFLNG